MMYFATLILLLFFHVSHFSFSVVNGYNILGICPSASYSHQQPFQALMKGLAARGHNVTMISTIPLKKPVENYEDVDLSFSYRKNDCTHLRHMSAYSILRKNMNEANELCEEQLFSSPIKNLILSNKTFDAIIIEQLWYQCYYSLVKHYNFPVLIGFLSVGNLPYVMDSVGNPDDPIFNPDMAYPFSSRMTMSECIWNILYTTWTRVYYRYWHLPRAQRIVDRWANGTSVRDIDKNFSLVILGNNHVFGYPKPLLPNVIEVHSLHLTENTPPLPEDIREFLDGAVDGAVYFSLGSNLQTHQLPPGPLTALYNALSSLKQRVLWKHSGDTAIHPANIKFAKWVPQRAVLEDQSKSVWKEDVREADTRTSIARFRPVEQVKRVDPRAAFAQGCSYATVHYSAHPRVMAYVMQGGLQSLQEAVHYSVPVIAIPFFGDQLFNARKILDAGIGLTLNVDTMTKESIVQTITEIIQNKTYLNNIKAMSNIVKDELVKPMDKAIWNIEHVLKFPHSTHLRYHGRDMKWISYYTTFWFFCLLLIIPILMLCGCLFMILQRIAGKIKSFFLRNIHYNHTKVKHS